ncbi:MAG: hypothetical protein ACFFCS_25260 [Candidatus Hodarchaeota archaeon]
MPKCLSCGCEIDESNEPSDALYQGGYCNSCSLAEEQHSKDDAKLYDTYISTLYSEESAEEPQEQSDEEERNEYEVLYADEDIEEEED